MIFTKWIEAFIDYFRTFQDTAGQRIAEPYSADQDNLVYWRARILFSILFTALVLCTFAIAAAIPLVIRENAWGLALFDLFGYAVCITLIFSKRIKYEIRAMITLLMFYVVGLVVILFVGPLSGGPAWLFAFAVLVGILLGSKPALLAILLNTISLGILAWLFSEGTLEHDFPFFKTSQAMFAAGVNFVVLNAIAAMSVAVLVKGLVSTHEKEKTLSESLKQEHKQLTEAKEKLEFEVEERKQAEEALKGSEARFRRAITEAPFPIMIHAEDGEVIQINEVWTQLTGYTKDEITTISDWTEKAYGEGGPLVKTGIDKLYDLDGRIKEGEYTVRTQADEELVWDFSSAPLGSLPDGRRMVISMAMDVTERKRARDEIEALARFPSENPSPILRIAEDGLVLYGNEASLSLLESWGCEIGHPLTDEWRDFILNTLHSNSSKNAEVAYDDRIVSLWFVPILDGIYVNVYGEDITQRKQAEEALQQSEERYRSLVENTLDGYFICEIPSGRFIFLNQRICDLAGYTMQEGLNLTIWDVVDPEEHQLIGERIKARMEGIASSFASNIYGAIRKDGSGFSAEVSTSLVTYQGKPVMQGVLRDVTEEQRLQLQLQQAQKMEAIGTLAGGIAHDFNNLLMGIQGRTSLMMTDMDSSHAQIEHLKGIEEYIRSATNLTKQLLGFARGGKYEVKPIDLNDLVKDSSNMFGRTRKEIKIHQKFQQDLWTVEVDRSQIEQVLLNLCVNAWQAMPAGGEIYLQTENIKLDEKYVKPHLVKPGKYVKISITDTGVGMDEVTRQRIFDPFFSTKEMGRGTGLGLASAYGIIKNHGGIINVYSEKGEGTTFNIYLPASEKKVVKEKEPEGELLKGSEMILLVDDEQMVIDVGRSMLEKLGYNVIVTNSGKAAVDLYQGKKEEIDIVILDMIMPEMNGGETYDRLKEINPKIKVLLSSGYSINGQAREILMRGCDGFIQKPFKLNELSQKLREILDRD